MHPQENVVTFQTAGDIKSGNVRNPKPCVDGKHQEILHVFTAPVAISGARRRGTAECVTSHVDPVQFGIRERRLIRGGRRTFRSLQILSDVFSEPLPLHAEFDEPLQPIQLLGARPLAIRPGRVKTIHVRYGQLIQLGIATRTAMSAKLLYKGAVLDEGRGLDTTVLSVGQEAFGRFGNGDTWSTRRRVFLGLWWSR